MGRKEVDSIALKGFQTEFSHILVVLYVFLQTQNPLKYVLIIPVVYHIIRYTLYFKEAFELTLRDRNLFWINLIDYIIILNLFDTSNTEVIIPSAIVSGAIGFSFVYKSYKQLQTKKGFSKNKMDDYFMIVLSVIYLFTNDPPLMFFGLRELVYHLSEIFIFY